MTDDFLRAYLARPEIGPVEESCAEELALHRALLANPRLEVGAERLAALADPDARENYEVWLGFRDVLVSRATLEDGYLALVRGGGAGRVPALFLDQLVHVILRTMLEGVRGADAGAGGGAAVPVAAGEHSGRRRAGGR